MEKDRPIGVIDSGVGGLTVLKWLQKKCPTSSLSLSGIRPVRLTGIGRGKKSSGL